MEEVAHYRRLYLDAAQQGTESDADFKRAFHTAVLNYWIELRPYRKQDILGEKWSETRLWKQDNGTWAKGLDALEHWINRQRTVAVQSQSGYDSGAEEPRAVTETLSGKALLRVSMILDEIASELGLRIDIEDGKRPKGRVNNPDATPDDGDSE
jgi:hypothetical protein